jgi:phosphate-selective porin OprO and OprP
MFQILAKMKLNFSKVYLNLPIVFLMFGFFNMLSAQVVESDERALLEIKDGISFKKDSLFLLNLRFRMQNRAGFNTLGGDNFSVRAYEMRVRRLRLRLDGYLLNPKIQYYIQLAFSKADMDLENGEIAQPIRDAIVYYHLNENLYFGFGQSKLPGNRQRVVSSGNLQFADRSIVNSLFTLDRDFGFFTYYKFSPSPNSLIHLKGAITTGDGRNASAINDGLAYTGRIEFLPFGTFKNNGDYSEGDLMFEPKPKLALGLTFSENKKATRTGGQLGVNLFEARDLSSVIFDAIYKHKGFSVLAEYMNRSTDQPLTFNSAQELMLVTVGHGVNFQASKMISPKSELASRYSYVVPSESISAYQKKVEEVLMGYTRYLNGHRIKVQGNIGYRWFEGLYGIENRGNFWTGMFQVEFGI